MKGSYLHMKSIQLQSYSLASPSETDRHTTPGGDNGRVTMGARVGVQQEWSGTSTWLLSLASICVIANFCGTLSWGP